MTLFSHEVTLLLLPSMTSTTEYGYTAGKNTRFPGAVSHTDTLDAEKKSFNIHEKSTSSSGVLKKAPEAIFKQAAALQDNFLSVTRQCSAQKLKFGFMRSKNT